MVAFVTGSGLGLQNTSLKLMGSDQAAAGNPNTGRALEQVYVNAANGNLIIQRQDDLLVSAGIDMVSLRTYNSQGVIAADKLNSGWRMSAVMSLANASAGINPNAAGSQILRTDRDGSSYLYAYNSSGAYAGKYTRADDPGARDVMSYASGSKRWTLDEGDSHAIHLFDWNNNAGKLQSSADADGNTISYSYNNDGAVTAIRDSASNESITYAYTSKLLTQVTTTRGNGSIVRVRYSYETYQVGGTNYQRLQTVRTDLSPDDSSVADGRVYEIGYEYLASSNQVSAITQTDGTRLKFDYDNARRVTAITQTSADGVTRTTQLSYGAGNTVIQDALGNRTTFTYDAANRLIGLLGPDGASHSYSYDDFDNLTSQTDGRGNVITYAYDDNGNQIRQQWGTGSSSGSGRTITRTYGARNQLLCETRYEGVDPDHGGSAAPLGAQTTRYVYNAQNHLIFEISPEGRVTEHRYDSKGLRSATLRHGGARYSASGTPTEAGMNGWVAALTDHAHSTRSDMSYDSRGLLASVTRYAALDASGNGVAAGKAVTTYVHDQAGRLLKTVSANGNATASASAGSTVYTYDGLGRRLSTTDALGNLGITLYNDAGRTDTTTEANGLLVTRVYNRAGELVTMTRSDSANALGSTRYWYDANGRLRMSEDPTGVRRHVLYDGAGRKLADIDGAGRLSTYVYNANGQLAGTRRHASALDPVRLASLLTAAGEPASITLAGLNPVFTAADAVSWNLYDSDGRLAKTVDALGYVSQTVYDGAGRVIATIGYANPIANVAALHAGSLPADASPLPDASQDRRTRHFHDADGLRIASLDAEGYLTSFEYDGAGRLIHTCKRASACSGDLAGASLAALMPAATAADIHAWTLYDAQDRIIASVDGEGYLTENTWDASGNRISQIRYGDQALQAPAAISANTTLANLRPGTGSNQITQWTYTDLNQVATQTDAFGSVTRHTWDSMGNLVQQERAYGDAAQARTLRNRYDRLGRLTAALSGEGSAALAALGNNPGQTQIDAVWAQYGVQYAYDHAGRRSAMTDAAGKRTLWFYDAEGQLTCTINALGEVEQRNYDAQQRLIDVVRYANRLPAATLAALTGGLHSAALASALQALADASRDSRLHYEYTVRGELQRQTDELGYVTQTEFNAFGEQSAQISALPGNGTSRSVSRYDRRGLLLQRTDDQGASRLNLTRNSAYDAFGRLWRSEDAAGNISTRSYDRNGRLVLSTDRNGSGTTWSYDAFDRVLTQTDALGNRTTTRYDDASHSMTVTSAEGVVLRTTRNRHGEVSQVSDGNGVLTIHTYDRDGHLTSSINSGLGAGESSSYDAAGRISSHNDARGVPTRYAYDAANRVLSRIVDPDGLALQTRYEYDARGRQVRITEPSGRVTLTDYDARGQVVLVTVDPDGANLRTRYQYDPAGRTVEVSTGWGSEQPASTRYVYDNLGRRIQEIRDPDGAHLVTSYRYDQAGFLVARTDASHRTTRYVNDAEGRVLWEVDAGGGVTANTYDSAGRLRMQRRYSVPLSLAGLGEELTAASIHPQAAASDAVSYTVYDRDGRVRYQVNGAGEVSQRQYDANGNVIVRITHANRLDAAGLAAVAAGAAPAAPAASALDRIERMAYDPGNRLVYRADALGALSEWVYDNNGQVVLSRRYSNTITPGAAFSVQSVAAAARRSAADQVDRTVYDNAGRALYRIDALGGVTGYLYNAAGDIRSTTRYASAIAVSDLGNMPAAATVAARLNPSVGADRTTSNLYDSAQRLVYSIDALGYVTGQRYASDGTLASTTRYASAINAASSVSVLAMNAALAARPEAERAQDRTTSWSYDAAGRLLRSTDAIGQSETYAYDGAGRKTAHTDKAGQTWTWQYDAAGRLAAELSPLVSASVSGSSGLWRMVVLTTCDGVGHVISRTEGALAASASFSGNAADLQQARTTTYSYDAAGRQTGITYPAVEVYGQGTANPQTTLWFDAHGNAIASRDVGGRYRYQLYDALGQVCYEVDAEGYITGYQRDAFGALTRLTRYGARLDNAQAYGAGGIGAAQLQTFLAGVSHAADRIVSTEYDALGRVQRVIEPQVYVFDQNAVGATGFEGARVTETTYNALGDVLRTDSHARKAADGTPGTLAATTFFRYDLLGRKSAELAVFQRSAAASQAYATTYRYDAHDQVIARTEYDAAVSLADAAWNAVSGMAYSEPATRGNADRMTVSTYDALGRKTSDTRVNVANGESGGTRLYSDLTTRYTYDGAGNQASVTDASGQTTFTWHDALGRVTAIGTLALAAGPDAQDPPVSPLTEFELDIYGNAVRRTDYAGGAERIGANGYVARVDPGRDRVTRIVYDQSGHARARTDAEGNQVDTDYDVYGRVARVRQYVSDDSGAYVAETLSEYDALGRESAVTTRRLDHGVASQAVTRSTLYNAFGEISAHTVNGSAYDYFDYDPAGRLWRSNSGDGVDKVYLHDAAGRQSAEIRSALRDLRAERDAATVAAAPAAELVRSETAYDLLGHVSARKLPTRYAQEIGSVNGSTVAAPRVLALQSAGVDLQVTAAAHQEWRDTSAGTSGPVWVGTNQVDLSWPSLAGLGAGEVRVELHYNGNSVDPAAPPATLTRSFGAAQAQSGARLSWEGAPLHAFDRIVVQKKDVWGNWAVLIDRSGSGDYGNLVRIHAPAELGTALRLRYRAAGAANWSTADAQHGLLHFGDTLVFDASALAEGNYDYVVEQQGATAAGWTVLDQGSIGLTSPAARRDVARLFVAILNRAPDAGAMARYVGALQNGSMTLAAIAHELYASAESQALGLYWSAPGVQKPATDFILNFYDVVLGRQPGRTDGQGLPELGADEIAYWQNRLAALAGDRAAVLLEMIGAIAAYRYDGGASTVGRDAQAWFDNKVRVGLMYAIDCAGYVPGDARAVLSGVTADPASVVIPAAIRQKSLYHNQVAQLYVLLFNRAPEGDGLNYWTGRLAGNEALASVAQAMYQSAVALGAYPADASAAQIISNIYNQALGRAPDAAGLAAWCARMDSPGVSRGQVLVEMIAAINAYGGTDPVAQASYRLFVNKSAVAVYYSTLSHSNLALPEQQVQAAGDVLANVTASATVLESVRAAAALASQQAADALAAHLAALALPAPTQAEVDELQAAVPASTAVSDITRLYVLLFNRAPDLDGFNYWLARRQGGESMEQIAEGFYTSGQQLGLLPTQDAGQSATIIRQIYAGALGRAAPPDADVDYWANRLAAAIASPSGYARGKVFIDLLRSVQTYTGTLPEALSAVRLFANKVALAGAYVALGGKDGEVPAGTPLYGRPAGFAWTLMDKVSASDFSSAAAAAQTFLDNARAELNAAQA